MKVLLWVPKAIWRMSVRVFGLVRDDGDVRELYGDNPNGRTEEERATSAGMTSNIVANMSYNGP